MPERQSQPKAAPVGAPREIARVREEINIFFKTVDSNGLRPAASKYGVYVFYDYDGDPLYVGQTEEGLNTRIRRHLTNQRTDAVAMGVLDPREVAEIEVFPFYDLDHPRDQETKEERVIRIKETLQAAEYAVYLRVIASSNVSSILNEKTIPERPPIELPIPFRRRIIPDDLYTDISHPDIRIARRASTIANLARVISERNVSSGLRRSLLTQAKRLEQLAAARLEQVGGNMPVEEVGEETD